MLNGQYDGSRRVSGYKNSQETEAFDADGSLRREINRAAAVRKRKDAEQGKRKATPQAFCRSVNTAVAVGIGTLGVMGLNEMAADTSVSTMFRNVLMGGALGGVSYMLGHYAVGDAAKDTASGRIWVGFAVVGGMLFIGTVSSAFSYIAVAKKEIERQVNQAFALKVDKVVGPRAENGTIAAVLRPVLQTELKLLNDTADCEDTNACLSGRQAPPNFKGPRPVSKLVRDGAAEIAGLEKILTAGAASRARSDQQQKAVVAKLMAIAVDGSVSSDERRRQVHASVQELKANDAEAPILTAVRNTTAALKAKEAGFVKDQQLSEGVGKAKALLVAVAERVEARLSEISQREAASLPDPPGVISVSHAYSTSVLKETWPYAVGSWLVELTPIAAFLIMVSWWRSRIDDAEGDTDG